jgi:hypothetical protein
VWLADLTDGGHLDGLVQPSVAALDSRCTKRPAEESATGDTAGTPDSGRWTFLFRDTLRRSGVFGSGAPSAAGASFWMRADRHVGIAVARRSAVALNHAGMRTSAPT